MDFVKFKDNELDTEGWSGFDALMRERHPVQFWIRDTTEDAWHWLCDVPHLVRRGFRWTFKPYNQTIRKAIPRASWCDITELSVMLNFACIVQFYKETLEYDMVDWDTSPEHRKFYDELSEYYNYIVNEYPRRWEDSMSSATENAIMEKETEIIKWVADNRGFMWT